MDDTEVEGIREPVTAVTSQIGAWAPSFPTFDAMAFETTRPDRLLIKSKRGCKALGVGWEKKIERSPAPAVPSGSMAGGRPKAVSGKAT